VTMVASALADLANQNVTVANGP